MAAAIVSNDGRSDRIDNRKLVRACANITSYSEGRRCSQSLTDDDDGEEEELHG